MNFIRKLSFFIHSHQPDSLEIYFSNQPDNLYYPFFVYIFIGLIYHLEYLRNTPCTNRKYLYLYQIDMLISLLIAVCPLQVHYTLFPASIMPSHLSIYCSCLALYILALQAHPVMEQIRFLHSS